MNPVYPFIIALVAIGWAWVIEKLDKDAAYYYPVATLAQPRPPGRWPAGVLR